MLVCIHLFRTFRCDGRSLSKDEWNLLKVGVEKLQSDLVCIDLEESAELLNGHGH